MLIGLINDRVSGYLLDHRRFGGRCGCGDKVIVNVPTNLLPYLGRPRSINYIFFLFRIHKSFNIDQMIEGNEE